MDLITVIEVILGVSLMATLFVVWVVIKGYDDYE